MHGNGLTFWISITDGTVKVIDLPGFLLAGLGAFLSLWIK